MKQELVGYAPDAHHSPPGVMLNCSAILPGLHGFYSAPTPATSGTTAALAAACRGAALATKLDETTRLFAGTSTKLYETSGAGWVDRTRAVGGNYALGSTDRWRFAQYGDVSLAVNKADILQSSSSGAFANAAANAPKASIVEVVGQFVFLFNVNDQGSIGPYGDTLHRWWCSKKGDYTDWTPAVATECTTGTLTSTPGKIRAGKRFGENVVAYKLQSMYLGVYVGPPAVWDFRLIPGNVGALCQEVVVNVGSPSVPQHLFMGDDDFYSYDGSRPVSIAENWVTNTVFSELNRNYSESCLALRDSNENITYFFYPSGASIVPDKCVVYNERTKKWGRDDRSVEAVVEYISAGTIYDDVGTGYSTYDSFPDVSYDSLFTAAAYPRPAIFDTSHFLKTLSGAPGAWSFTTGDIGDDNVESLIRRVRLRFLHGTLPTNCQMQNFYRQNLGDALMPDQTAYLSNGKFDVLRSARWHRFVISGTGDMETNIIDYDLVPEGTE